MLYVVTGGSGSGKSEYAERVAARVFQNLCGNGKARQKEAADAGRARQKDSAGRLYYLATMKPYDEECYARIARHRLMRREKGFETLECPCRIEAVKASERDVLLLEDLSNLLANEQYLEEGRIKGTEDAACRQAAEAVLRPLMELSRSAGCVVVVTNEIFSDGADYEAETREYCRLLGFLNRELAGAADGVAEVVCGIAICQKGELPC